MQKDKTTRCILIVEDDPEQMEFLNALVSDELRKIKKTVEHSPTVLSQLNEFKILRVTNIASLKKAVQIYSRVILAIVDCNLPDTKDSAPNDQLIQTNYRITGQHRSVDILKDALPNTPITMTSSQDRFQKIVSQYYLKNFDLEISFIRKRDHATLQRNTAYHLRDYLRHLDDTPHT